MQNKEDIRTKLPKSFLKDRTVLFLGSQTGPAHRYIENASASLADLFSDAGYSFVFLPYLAFNLEPSVLGYMFPGMQGAPDVQAMSQRIEKRAGLDGKPGFLYKRSGVTYFHAIPDHPEKSIETAIDKFIASLEEPVETDSIRFSKTGGLFDLAPGAGDYIASERFELPKSIKEPLDPKVQAILDAWERIEEQFGITIKDLEIILGYRVKLSHLKITTAGKIILTDWGNGTEVKMDDLTKALYFFYLKHPEGIALKELQDYESEILRYYMSVTGRDDRREIEKSVHNFLDPFGNSINVSISRIKKAFRDIVGDHIAKFYYIDGHYAGVRKIALDRDYVIWDH